MSELPDTKGENVTVFARIKPRIDPEPASRTVPISTKEAAHGAQNQFNKDLAPDLAFGEAGQARARQAQGYGRTTGGLGQGGCRRRHRSAAPQRTAGPYLPCTSKANTAG